MPSWCCQSSMRKTFSLDDDFVLWPFFRQVFDFFLFHALTFLEGRTSCSISWCAWWSCQLLFVCSRGGQFGKVNGLLCTSHFIFTLLLDFLDSSYAMILVVHIKMNFSYAFSLYWIGKRNVGTIGLWKIRWCHWKNRIVKTTWYLITENSTHWSQLHSLGM